MRGVRRTIATAFIVVAVASLTLTSSVSADPPGFHWNSSFGGWIDDDCPGVFKVDFAAGELGSGSRVRLCHSIPDLRDVPRGAAGTANFDNHITSLKTYDASFACGSGNDTSGYFKLYHGYLYGGTVRTIIPTPPDSWQNLYASDDDKVSSVYGLCP